MSRLEVKMDGDDVAADKMLTMATLLLKLIRSIEREYAKKDGKKLNKKNRIRWRVDMQSGFSYGLIVLRGETPEGQRDTPLHQETTQEIMKEALRLQAQERP